MGSKTPSSVPGVFLQKRNNRNVMDKKSLTKKHLRSISSKEMITRLLRGELAHRWEHAKRITSQHDDIGGLTVDHTRHVSIWDILDRVSAARVLCDADIVIVWHARQWIVDHVLENAPEAYSVEDLWFFLCGEVDALGVASTFDVEDATVRPHVFVVSDEKPAWVR